MTNMRTLELFSGKNQSFSSVAQELGCECLTLDIMADADYKMDIMDFDYKKFPPGYFGIIWASPPCNTFSIMRRSNIGRKLKAFGDLIVTKKILDDDMIATGVPILRKAQEIINYLNPDVWFIENPKTGRMKDFMENQPFYDVDYCRYGFTYKKSTRIWTNLKNFIPKTCNRDRNLRHENQMSDFSLKQRYAVPKPLIHSLLKSIVFEF